MAQETSRASCSRATTHCQRQCHQRPSTARLSPTATRPLMPRRSRTATRALPARSRTDTKANHPFVLHARSRTLAMPLRAPKSGKGSRKTRLQPISTPHTQPRLLRDLRPSRLRPRPMPKSLSRYRRPKSPPSQLSQLQHLSGRTLSRHIFVRRPSLPSSGLLDKQPTIIRLALKPATHIA